MINEVIVTAKTVELAVQQGAEQLGQNADKVSYDVLAEAKKGFLGIGEAPAKVRVYFEETDPSAAGVAFVNKVIADMGLNANASAEPVKGEKKEYLISIEGEDASVMIGHHGATLDALQYLTNLAANRKDDDDAGYVRFTVDVENYRSKREETLRRLAKRMAEKALKSGRNVALEPMSSYERRIIHSEIQGMNGVTTNSVGSDSNRRIIITVENPAPRREKKKAKAPVETKPAFTGKEEEFSEDYVPSTTLGPITKRARFDESLPEYQSDGYTDNVKETH